MGFWTHGLKSPGGCAGRRARELFDALDDDGNGVLTEEEFVQVTHTLQIM